MKKGNQFITASVFAVVGIVLLSINRFSASADSLSSYSQKFPIVLFLGLVIAVAAAFWFYRLSKKD